MPKRALFAVAGCFAAGVAACYAGQKVPASGIGPLEPVQEPTEIRVTVGEGADRTEVRIQLTRGTSETECRTEWRMSDGTRFAPMIRAAHGTTARCTSEVEGKAFNVEFVDGKSKSKN